MSRGISWHQEFLKKLRARSIRLASGWKLSMAMRLYRFILILISKIFFIFFLFFFSLFCSSYLFSHFECSSFFRLDTSPNFISLFCLSSFFFFSLFCFFLFLLFSYFEFSGFLYSRHPNFFADMYWLPFRDVIEKLLIRCQERDMFTQKIRIRVKLSTSAYISYMFPRMHVVIH